MSQLVILRRRWSLAGWMRGLFRTPAQRKRRALLKAEIERQLEKKLAAIKRDVFSWEPFVHRDDARTTPPMT